MQSLTLFLKELSFMSLSIKSNADTLYLKVKVANSE